MGTSIALNAQSGNKIKFRLHRHTDCAVHCHPQCDLPSMKRFIYKSVPHKDKLGRTPLDICSILDPVQSLQCEMLLMTDTHCHFGNSSTYYSANLLPVGASWDVYIKPGRPIEEGTAKKVKCLFFQLSRPARQRKFSRPK